MTSEEIKLTDQERIALCRVTEQQVLVWKTLRVIDALVAQLEAAKLRSAHEKRTRERLVRHYTKRRDLHFKRAEKTRAERDALMAQIAELTQERDEARSETKSERDSVREFSRRVRELESEVTRLTRERDEARAEAETAFANGAEQSKAECDARGVEVTRLTAERDAVLADVSKLVARATTGEREVARLDKRIGIYIASINAAESEVTRLTQERDEARERWNAYAAACTKAELEVARLTESLEAEKLAHALTQSSERANADALAAAERKLSVVVGESLP